MYIYMHISHPRSRYYFQSSFRLLFSGVAFLFGASISLRLIFTPPWAYSADNKLLIFFLIFPRKQDLTFHKMQNSVSLEKREKYSNMSSALNFTQSAKR